MKIMLTERAYLDLGRGPQIVKPGAVIEWEKDKCPSWAKEVGPVVPVAPVVESPVVDVSETPWVKSEPLEAVKAKRGRPAKAVDSEVV